MFVCLPGLESINSQPIELGVVPIDAGFEGKCRMLWRGLVIVNSKKVELEMGLIDVEFHGESFGRKKSEK